MTHAFYTLNVIMSGLNVINIMVIDKDIWNPSMPAAHLSQSIVVVFKWGK
jgi:hypothetical protein